jgi:hypothetical protein
MPRLALALLLLGVRGGAGDEGPSAFRFADDPQVKVAVDRAEILRGVDGTGDPRDVIRAIDGPEAAPAAEATWLRDDERVLGLVVNGEARAYPLRVLETHEMVNDVLGGVPVGPNY